MIEKKFKLPHKILFSSRPEGRGLIAGPINTGPLPRMPSRRDLNS
jgi:hypothetical protein